MAESSLVSSSSVKAPQLMAKKGPSARLLLKWRYRANSSLPVPLSPVISTLQSVGAIWRAVSRSRCTPGSWVMILTLPW